MVIMIKINETVSEFWGGFFGLNNNCEDCLYKIEFEFNNT